jgi:hypothetical protein
LYWKTQSSTRISEHGPPKPPAAVVRTKTAHDKTQELVLEDAEFNKNQRAMPRVQQE